MKKLTKEEIDKITELRNEGKKQWEIGSIFGVSQKTIHYWLMPEDKRKEEIKKTYDYFKKKSLEERREIYKRRLPYLKEYFKTKYKNNKEFRLKEIERAKNNVRSKKN